MNFLTVILVTVLVGNQCLGEASPLSADELVFEGLENISTEQPLGLLESIILAEDVQVVGDSSTGGGEKDMTGHSHTNTANDDDTAVNADEVAGGQEVSIEDFPHQVSFRYNDDQQFCGGFIISEYYILTAAHCTEGMVASEVTLHAGSTMRSEGQVIPIAEVIAHPEYDDPQYDKDVAVMRTAERIEFTDKIQPIRLAEEGRTVEAGTKVVISGWGQEQYGESSVVGSLLAVEIPVVNREQCALVYETVTRNQFCAGNFFLGGQGTCQGDSGGAVVQNGTAVGIVSYGRGCGQPLSPSVFADLSAAEVRGFVKEHTGL